MAVLNIKTLSPDIQDAICRKEATDYVYVGRYCSSPKFSLPASKLANPFKIGTDCSRPDSVRQYKQWLWEQIKEYLKTQSPSPAVRELLKLIEKKLAGEEFDLVCWCAPEACHADVIEAAINWGIESGELLPF